MKPAEIREKTEAELAKLESELEESILRMHLAKGVGQLKATAGLRMARHDLARLKTIQREKKA